MSAITDNIRPKSGATIEFAGKQVTVVYEPDLWRAGETRDATGLAPTVILREWDERVFLHELLHVVLNPTLAWFRQQPDFLCSDGSIVDPYERVVQAVEWSLWGYGWRLCEHDTLRGDQ